MATNPYSYGSLGQRWTVGEPTSKSLLDVSRVKADANRWALEQLVVDPDDTANFVLTAPGLNIDSNTLYVDSVNNSVGFGLTNPNDYAFNGTPSWVASGGAGNASVIVVSGTTSIGYLSFADGTTGTDRYSGNIQYNHGTNTMSFRTNGGVEAVTINSAQDLAVGTDKLFVDVSASAVGVGTSSPSGLGQRSLNVKAPSSGGADLTIEADNGNNFGVFFSGATASDPFSIYSNTGFKFATASDKNATGFSEHMRITSTGNLSLSAGYVTVAGNPSAGVISSNGNGQIGGLTGNGLYMYGKGSTYDLALANANTSIALAIPTGGSATPDVYIPNLLGIGAASPSAALHVNNGASITNLPANTRAIFSNGSGADAISRVGIYAGAGSGFAVLDLGRNDASSRSSITYNASADSLAFGTGGGGADMTIDSSGNLLVGTTDASGVAGSGIKLTNPTSPADDGKLMIVGATSTSGQDAFQVYSTGASAYRFFVNYAGSVYATSTSITAISDQSLKENVRDLDKGLDTVLALQPRRFDWKNGDGNDIMGFVAQEVEEVMPELVHDFQYTATETKLGLKMGDMVPTLVKAIQDQQEIIDNLKSRIEQLEGVN